MSSIQPNSTFAQKYKLIELLDTGGFAEVWKAVHTVFNNEVALKIFPKLDEAAREQIKIELETGLKMKHDHLLTAYHADESEDGHLFLVMPLCRGGNISKMIGKIDEMELAIFVEQSASALSYLHSKDVVHADIKPNNFLKGKDHEYFLSDLGLSYQTRATVRRTLNLRTSEESNSSRLGVVPGVAPACYRGPELFDVSKRNTPPIKASDIWAYGASIYELLTTDLPFGELGGILQLNDSNKTPDLSENFINSDINLIVKACLHSNTWDRPSASQLNKWAKNFIDSESYWLDKNDKAILMDKLNGVEPPPPPPPPSDKWLTLAGILSAVLLVFTLGYKYLYRTRTPNPDPTLIVVTTPQDTTNTVKPVEPGKSIIKQVGSISSPPPSEKEPSEEEDKFSGGTSGVTGPGAGVTPPPPPPPPVVWRATSEDNKSPKVVSTDVSSSGVRIKMRYAPNEETKVNLYEPGHAQAFKLLTPDRTLLSLQRIDGPTGENINVSSKQPLEFTLFFGALPQGIEGFKIKETGAGHGMWSYEFKKN
jgi:serine/threonine protein kinase